VKSDTKLPLDEIVIGMRDSNLQTFPLVGDSKKLVNDFGIKYARIIITSLFIYLLG
jgi:hypothetical protein